MGWADAGLLLNQPREDRAALVRKEASPIADEDVAMARPSPERAEDHPRLQKSRARPSHSHPCNAGWLAKRGLAPADYLACVASPSVDETRPRTRAPRYRVELGSHGVDHTILPTMPAAVHRPGRSLVIVGTDQ
jgi:hypothetical protein